RGQGRGRKDWPGPNCPGQPGSTTHQTGKKAFACRTCGASLGTLICTISTHCAKILHLQSLASYLYRLTLVNKQHVELVPLGSYMVEGIATLCLGRTI